MMRKDYTNRTKPNYQSLTLHQHGINDQMLENNTSHKQQNQKD
jgi:hypothetical protein